MPQFRFPVLQVQCPFFFFFFLARNHAHPPAIISRSFKPIRPSDPCLLRSHRCVFRSRCNGNNQALWTGRLICWTCFSTHGVVACHCRCFRTRGYGRRHCYRCEGGKRTMKGASFSFGRAFGVASVGAAFGGMWTSCWWEDAGRCVALCRGDG